MCLGVPGRITDIHEKHGTTMASIDFGGIHKEVCLAYLPEAEVGDYALVHVGFAITRIDEASALETLELIRAIGNLAEELGEEPGAEPVGAGPDAPVGSERVGSEPVGSERVGSERVGSERVGSERVG